MFHTLIYVYKLPHAPLELPFYATKGSAGMDVQAAIGEPITLQSLERKLIPTGLILHIPEHYEVQLRPRSGLSIKYGVTLVNCVGTIDSDYRKEVFVPLINLSSEPYAIEPGERIAQMIAAPLAHAKLEEVFEIIELSSRSGGFGSTGK
jgi:dUTP pyrophosphatase